MAPSGVDGGAGERLLAQRANTVEGLLRLFGPKAEAGAFLLKSYGRPTVSAGPPLHGAKGQTGTSLVKKEGLRLTVASQAWMGTYG